MDSRVNVRPGDGSGCGRTDRPEHELHGIDAGIKRGQREKMIGTSTCMYRYIHRVKSSP